MKKLFEPDSVLVKFLTKLCDLVLINLILDCCLLTIAFSGAAILSLYEVLFREMREEDSSLLPGFLHIIKKNIIPAFPATVLLFVDGMLWAVVVRCLFAEELLLHPAVLLVLALGSLLLAAVLSYLFPLIANYENTFPRHLKNGVLLMLGNPKATLFLLSVNLFPLLCVTAFPGSLHLVLGFWLLIGFAGSAFLNAQTLQAIFDGTKEENP